MSSKLAANPKYSFALAFLTWVDPIKSNIVPDNCQYLAILQELENHPLRVANATIPDTLKNIFEYTENWDDERVDSADKMLASHSALTLTAARELWQSKRTR